MRSDVGHGGSGGAGEAGPAPAGRALVVASPVLAAEGQQIRWAWHDGSDWHEGSLTADTLMNASPAVAFGATGSGGLVLRGSVLGGGLGGEGRTTAD